MCKKCSKCKKNYSWNPSTCIYENGKYSVLANVSNTLSTNMTNTISTNVTSTTSTNSDGKALRYKLDCYILHTIFDHFTIIDHIKIDNCYYLLLL